MKKKKEENTVISNTQEITNEEKLESLEIKKVEQTQELENNEIYLGERDPKKNSTKCM